jgi:hypothetical protein
MRRNIPYAMLVPIAVVCFAVVLMIWSLAGTSGGRPDRSTTTTGSASSRTNEQPARVPTAPNNDTAADSARGSGPLNKSR